MQLPNNGIIKKGQGVVPAGRISAKKKLRGGIKKPAFQARQFPSSPRQNSPARRPVPAFRPSPASGRSISEDSKEEDNEDEKEEQSQTSQGQSAMPEQLQRKEQTQQQLNSDAEQQDAGAEMRAQQNEQRRQSQSSPAESLSGENSISENPSLPEMPARQNVANNQMEENGGDRGNQESGNDLNQKENLNNPEEEGQAADKLKEQRNPGVIESQSSGDLKEDQTKARKKSKLKEAKDKAANFVDEKMIGLMQKCWLNAAETLGLTLFGVQLNMFCRTVFSQDLFPELGKEFVPKELRQSNPEEAKAITKKAKLLAIAGICAYDLAFLSMIGTQLLFIILIVYFLDMSWYEKLKFLLGNWDFLRNVVS